MRLEIPEGNVRVPLARFQEIWTEAEARFRDDRVSRYLGGVCAACRWAAGHPAALSPLHRLPVTATAELILQEDMAATMTYTRAPGGDPTIDADWAAGVALTLGWARGTLADDPLARP